MDEIDILKHKYFQKVLSCCLLLTVMARIPFKITMMMAQDIIRYCIHHTKTSGYSIAYWCRFSTADWETEESRVDTRQG
jgi:hypothetical protein